MGGIIMTREEARKAAEVMMSYAEGKDIEFCKNGEDWKILRGDDCRQLSFAFNLCEYRIKQEPTYRPFKDKEECWAEMKKHQPFGWIMAREAFRQVLIIGNYYICFEGITFDYNEAFEEVKFVDGTPFGIKEE